MIGIAEFRGTASTTVRADARAVFGLITDIARLPEWNAAVERILELPPRVVNGEEWVAVIHPRRMPAWKSRSRIEEVDPGDLRFRYTSRNEDGNPSYAEWAWEVAPRDDHTDVTVRWDVHLKTIDRKVIAAPIRRRALAREVPASLRALGTVLRGPDMDGRGSEL